MAEGMPGVQVEAFGIGGPRLQAAGLEAIVDTRQLMVMGFTEILGHLPKIVGILGRVARVARERRPDIAVVIDYPDFHFRLSKQLGKAGIPLIYYIPPKVWVWRKGRLGFLKKNFEKLLCIFPFEEAFYQGHQIGAKYVGNPLMDELPFGLDRATARRRLQLDSEKAVVVLMPGSRAAELKRHIPIMMEACQLVAQKIAGPLDVLIPFPQTIHEQELEKARVAIHKHGSGLKIRISKGDAADCLVAADAGVIKSGTSTLEAGLLKCPHLIVYQPSPISTWIYKNVVRYQGTVGLVNLVSEGERKAPLVKELLCEEATAEQVSVELLKLLEDQGYRKEMIEGFKQLKATLEGKSSGESPSVVAAREVLATLMEVRPDRGLNACERS